MYLHVYAKVQRNHSRTSKMRKTPHFGQFSNGTLLFYLCESKQGRTKGSHKTGSLDYPSLQDISRDHPAYSQWLPFVCANIMRTNITRVCP